MGDARSLRSPRVNWRPDSEETAAWQHVLFLAFLCDLCTCLYFCHLPWDLCRDQHLSLELHNSGPLFFIKLSVPSVSLEPWKWSNAWCLLNTAQILTPPVCGTGFSPDTQNFLSHAISSSQFVCEISKIVFIIFSKTESDHFRMKAITF